MCRFYCTSLPHWQLVEIAVCTPFLYTPQINQEKKCLRVPQLCHMATTPKIKTTMKWKHLAANPFEGESCCTSHTYREDSKNIANQPHTSEGLPEGRLREVYPPCQKAGMTITSKSAFVRVKCNFLLLFVSSALAIQNPSDCPEWQWKKCHRASSATLSFRSGGAYVVCNAVLPQWFTKYKDEKPSQGEWPLPQATMCSIPGIIRTSQSCAVRYLLYKWASSSICCTDLFLAGVLELPHECHDTHHSCLVFV